MKRENTFAPRARRGAAALVCAGSLALLLGGAALLAQDPPPDDADQQALAARVDGLEKSLTAANVQVRALTDELGEMLVLLDQTVRYLQREAQGAATMAATLDEVEQLGFTYGINPKSREALLAGWRERLQDAQTGVPGAPPAPAEGAEGELK